MAYLFKHGSGGIFGEIIEKDAWHPSLAALYKYGICFTI